MATSIKIGDQLKVRESFKQEALSSWTDYQETGKHLTGGEIRDWLSTWGTGEEAEVSECHE